MEKKPIRIFNIKYTEEDRRKIHELIDGVIDEAFLTNHTFCRKLENLVNNMQNSNFSVATSSATAGLETVFRTIDIRNKAVIVQSNTFIATAHAVQAAGGIIVPLDLDNEFVASYDDLINSFELCKKNDLDIGAVCIVHIAGRASSNLVKIRDFLTVQDIPLVEDNAQGFLSTLYNQYLGTFGDFSVTSFQTTKVVACGEGGIISSLNEKEYSKVKNNIFFGKSESFPRLFDKIAGNFKLSELNAALAIADIERSKKRIQRRRLINNRYKNEVISKKIKFLDSPIGNNPSCYKTIFLSKDEATRKNIEEIFIDESIAMTGSVYREPISVQPRVISSSKFIERELPKTIEFCNLHFAPPNYPELIDEEVDRIIYTLNKA